MNLKKNETTPHKIEKLKLTLIALVKQLQFLLFLQLTKIKCKILRAILSCYYICILKRQRKGERDYTKKTTTTKTTEPATVLSAY